MRRGARDRRARRWRAARRRVRALILGGLFAAERHRAAGDFATYAAELEDALARRPDHPATLYNLACAEALAGRSEEALTHLRRALELKPEWTEMAGKDDDLAALRELPDWPGSDT